MEEKEKNLFNRIFAADAKFGKVVRLCIVYDEFVDPSKIVNDLVEYFKTMQKIGRENSDCFLPSTLNVHEIIQETREMFAPSVSSYTFRTWFLDGMKNMNANFLFEHYLRGKETHNKEIRDYMNKYISSKKIPIYQLEEFINTQVDDVLVVFCGNELEFARRLVEEEGFNIFCVLSSDAERRSNAGKENVNIDADKPLDSIGNRVSKFPELICTIWTDQAPNMMKKRFSLLYDTCFTDVADHSSSSSKTDLSSSQQDTHNPKNRHQGSENDPESVMEKLKAVLNSEKDI